jgi:hypothetical protein
MVPRVGDGKTPQHAKVAFNHDQEARRTALLAVLQHACNSSRE